MRAMIRTRCASSRARSRRRHSRPARTVVSGARADGGPLMGAPADWPFTAIIPRCALSQRPVRC